jgi:putative peptidoglycan lipid II flippase
MFERGAFGPETTEVVARALRYFALGLPAFVLIKVFSPGFFAREDTKTPMYIAGFSIGLNIAFSLALFPTMAEAGIALATTISGWANALLLLFMLMKRGDWPLEAGTVGRSALTLAVSLAMAGALALGAGALEGAMAPAAGIGMQAAALFLLVAGGAAIYFGGAQVTGAADLRGIVRNVRRR